MLGGPPKDGLFVISNQTLETVLIGQLLTEKPDHVKEIE